MGTLMGTLWERAQCTNAQLLNFQEELARPERFELPTPRFVVWGKTIGLIEDRSHNNWCLKLLHDLRHESVATFGSISYFGDTSRKLVLNTRSGLHRQQLGMPTAAYRRRPREPKPAMPWTRQSPALSRSRI
jgi:hypothetical protein